MSGPGRALPAAAAEQRKMVARDVRWATRGSLVFAVACAAAAVGNVVGTAARGGAPGAAAYWWMLGAVAAVIWVGLCTYAGRLAKAVPADEWPEFYARYTLLAWWHRAEQEEP